MLDKYLRKKKQVIVGFVFHFIRENYIITIYKIHQKYQNYILLL